MNKDDIEEQSKASLSLEELGEVSVRLTQPARLVPVMAVFWCFASYVCWRGIA